MRMAKKVQSSLNRAHCEYDIVAHRHSSSSLETARVAGVPAERVAGQPWPNFEPTRLHLMPCREPPSS